MKRNRFLAALLAVLLVVGIMPLTSMAAAPAVTRNSGSYFSNGWGSDEVKNLRKHTSNNGTTTMYSGAGWTINVKGGNAGGESDWRVTASENTPDGTFTLYVQKWNGRNTNIYKYTVTVKNGVIGNNFINLGSGTGSNSVNEVRWGASFNLTKYPYTINYEYYLDGVLQPGVTFGPQTGSASAGTVITALDGTQTVGGNAYTLGGGQPTTLTVAAEGTNTLTLRYDATTPAPTTYPYTINYAYYLDDALQSGVTFGPQTGSASAGTVITALDGTQTVGGNAYTLGGGQSTTLTVSMAGPNTLTLRYDATTPTPQEPTEYDYTVQYVYTLDEVIQSTPNKADRSGTAPAGALTLPDDGGATDGVGNSYTLTNAGELNVTISPEGGNVFVLHYGATTGGEGPENPESPTPPYIPPQILIPTPAPTPQPEIEIPPEEIPTTVTEEEPGSEFFEDEEIPTDVPETGEASAILPVILLAGLAGAAFVLAARKSRNNA